jgi:CO dehydrogenase maturation factor
LNWGRINTMLVAIAGKGGVGKTTLTAAWVRLLQSKSARNFCVVDADPVGVLGALLGAETRPSVAQIAEQSAVVNEAFAARSVALAPMPGGGQLLRMGYPSSAGCFCRVNGLTRLLIAQIVTRFPLVLMDNEAGLEHAARGTSDAIDRLVLVGDRSRASLDVARAALETARALGRLNGAAYLVVRANETELIQTAAREMGLPEPYFIPDDPGIAQAQMNGEPLPAFTAAMPLFGAVEAWLRQCNVMGGQLPKG